MKISNKSFKLLLFSLLGLALLLPVAWLLAVRLEGRAPEVALTPEPVAIGVSGQIGVSASDPDSGLRSVRVVLYQKEKRAVLLDHQFPGRGVFRGGAEKAGSFTITVEPAQVGLSDGDATLSIAVEDHSWRRWWHGNRTERQMSVQIDTRPPRIEVLTRAHNLSQGGAGLVIYRLSEPCPTSGVSVGDNYFPGYPGQFDDERIVAAFFALHHNQGRGTPLAVQAVDRAGNSASTGFPHYIRKRVFKTDSIVLSDGFLNQKMPEFASAIPQAAQGSALERFLAVNTDLRRANYETLTGITAVSEPRMMWEGRFLRLANSATQAGFADHREYLYNGKVIDRQVHLGIDLASVAQCPIPAGNRGRVAFTGELGIYGLTVVIDHGLGLFSMYSHLSGIDVQPDQQVAREEIIGRSGTTGLAGGDHLHFSIMLHNTFVNPLEWWDPEWIRNNVTSKIDSVRTPPDQG